MFESIFDFFVKFVFTLCIALSARFLYDFIAKPIVKRQVDRHHSVFKPLRRKTHIIIDHYFSKIIHIIHSFQNKK